MNNKPVAWIKESTLIYLGNYNYASITIQAQKSKSVGFDIPLYTHPVKELTDEEWLITYQTWALTGNDPLVLKQAILRKAQEK